MAQSPCVCVCRPTTSRRRPCNFHSLASAEGEKKGEKQAEMKRRTKRWKDLMGQETKNGSHYVALFSNWNEWDVLNADESHSSRWDLFVLGFCEWFLCASQTEWNISHHLRIQKLSTLRFDLIDFAKMLTFQFNWNRMCSNGAKMSIGFSFFRSAKDDRTELIVLMKCQRRRHGKERVERK